MKRTASLFLLASLLALPGASFAQASADEAAVPDQAAAASVDSIAPIDWSLTDVKAKPAPARVKGSPKIVRKNAAAARAKPRLVGGASASSARRTSKRAKVGVKVPF